MYEWAVAGHAQCAGHVTSAPSVCRDIIVSRPYYEQHGFGASTTSVAAMQHFAGRAAVQPLHLDRGERHQPRSAEATEGVERPQLHREHPAGLSYLLLDGLMGRYDEN